MSVTFSFRCPCGEAITVDSATLRKVIKCSACNRPLRTPRIHTAEGRSIIRCTCFACGGRINVALEQQGKTLHCEDCGNSVEVPGILAAKPPGAPAATPPSPVATIVSPPPTQDMRLTLEDEELLAPETAPAVPAPPAEFAPEPLPGVAQLSRAAEAELEGLKVLQQHKEPQRVLPPLEPAVLAGVGGAALVLLGVFLPWVGSSDGPSASFFRLMGNEAMREMLPGATPLGFFLIAWAALVAFMAITAQDAGLRARWLMGLFVAALAALCWTWSACTTDGGVGGGHLLRALHVGAYFIVMGVLATGAAGVLSARNAPAAVRTVAIIGGVGVLLAVCLLTNWFRGSREWVTLVVQMESGGARNPQATITAIVANAGKRVVRFALPAKPRWVGPAQRYRLILQRRNAAGEWQEISPPDWGVKIVPPARLLPGQNAKLKFSLAPAWDLTAPGSEALSPQPESWAGTYRCLLEHPDTERRAVAEFAVKGVPHPDAAPAVEFAKAKAAEQEARFIEAAQIYDAIVKGFPTSGFAAKAREARQHISAEVIDQQERAALEVTMAQVRTAEDEGRLADALKLLKAIRLSASSPHAETVSAHIKRLTDTQERLRQEAIAAMLNVAVKAMDASQYEAAIAASNKFIAAYPDTPQAGQAASIRDRAVAKRAEEVIAEGVQKVDAALARNDLMSGVAIARQLEGRAQAAAKAGDPVQQKALDAFVKKRQESEALFAKLTCRKRADLLDQYLAANPDLDAATRDQLTTERDKFAAREANAEKLDAVIQKTGPQTKPWYLNMGRLFRDYADTEVALRRQGVRRIVDDYFKRNPAFLKEL